MEAQEILYMVIAAAVVVAVADAFLLGDPLGIATPFIGPKPTPIPSPTQTPIPPTPTPVVFPNVTITELVNSSCGRCFNISKVTSYFEQNAESLGVRFTGRRVVDVNSAEGSALAERYNITRVPTFILSKEAGQSQQMRAVWADDGSIEADGTLVLRAVYPPYIDLSSGALVGGNVTLINILYEPCTRCYDVGRISALLESQYSVSVFDTVNYSFNSTEWNATVATYNITRVPTTIVSRELGLYPGVEAIWLAGLGTKEPDGSYVFRTMNVSGIAYYDLLLNSTVERIE